jgi:hypothetical protein
MENDRVSAAKMRWIRAKRNPAKWPNCSPADQQAAYAEYTRLRAEQLIAEANQRAQALLDSIEQPA